MAMGVVQIEGVVVAKPDPSVSKNGKQTYYTCVVEGQGFRQRLDCTQEVYNQIAVDEGRKVIFQGKMRAIRGKQQGGQYDDDLQKVTLDKVVPPSATK